MYVPPSPLPSRPAPPAPLRAEAELARLASSAQLFPITSPPSRRQRGSPPLLSGGALIAPQIYSDNIIVIIRPAPSSIKRSP